MKVDAIVNAANETLLGGGGVDGCIHRAAGPGLLAECRALGGCKTGSAKITGAGKLPCKYVIHAVGPRWIDGRHGERENLISCYRTSLALAKEHACETLAFPLISSGIYGYPKDEALHVATAAIGEFLLENEMTVYLVIFDRKAYEIGTALFADIAEYIDDRYADTLLQATPRSMESAPNRTSSSPRTPDSADPGTSPEAYTAENALAVPTPAQAAPPAPSMPAPASMSSLMALTQTPPPGISVPPKPQAPSKAPRFSKLRKSREAFEPSAAYKLKEPSIQTPAPTDAGSRPRSLFHGRKPASLDDALKQIDESFSEMLLRKIDESGMTDAQCYKKANIDRKLFSKIRGDRLYKPSKPTVIAFAIALELPLGEVKDMLMKAGYALSHSSKFDIIIEYFIENGNYNVFEINEALFAFDQSLLGT